MEFSRKQINELISGVQLSAEIPSSSPELRHFVSVRGYIDTECGIELLDRIINEDKIETAAFWIRDYEIPSEYIENDWEIPDNKIVNYIFINGIIGIESLQKELKKHISDLSLLIPHWECDAPLGQYSKLKLYIERENWNGYDTFRTNVHKTLIRKVNHYDEFFYRFSKKSMPELDLKD